ncbi:MAG: PPC domain-containing DNA-binding protein [candidate division WOR-3 bacterium]
MTCVRNGAYWQLRLERGEDVPTEVAGFVLRHQIRSGLITGLGAADMVVLGHFSLRTKKYRKRKLAGEYEIAGILGNIAWDGKVPVCHMHAVVTGPDMKALGGHLFAARVAATCEISILPGARRLGRKLDQTTGLKLLALRSRG